MKKNYPKRRWQSENQRALLYLELDELTLVIRPKFEGFLLEKKFKLSYSETYFRRKFKNFNEAQSFAKKMKSPFEIIAEEQGFLPALPFYPCKASIPKIGINTHIWDIVIFTNHILWRMVFVRVSYLRKICGINTRQDTALVIQAYHPILTRNQRPLIA